jgi:hypothetical protein
MNRRRRAGVGVVRDVRIQADFVVSADSPAGEGLVERDNQDMQLP